MEIIGLHYHILDKIECRIKIQSRIISIYPINTNDESKINNPVNNEKWNFRKVNWKESKPVKPKDGNILSSEWVWKYSHVIEYMTDKNETQRIFINPNRIQRFLIRYNNKQLLYQKFTAPEYIAGVFVTILLNIFSSLIYSFISDQDKIPVINNNPITSDTAIINAGISVDTINHPNIIDSTIISSTQDLKRHQGDSLRQR